MQSIKAQTAQGEATQKWLPELMLPAGRRQTQNIEPMLPRDALILRPTGNGPKYPEPKASLFSLPHLPGWIEKARQVALGKVPSQTDGIPKRDAVPLPPSPGKNWVGKINLHGSRLSGSEGAQDQKEAKKRHQSGEGTNHSCSRDCDTTLRIGSMAGEVEVSQSYSHPLTKREQNEHNCRCFSRFFLFESIRMTDCVLYDYGNFRK